MHSSSPEANSSSNQSSSSSNVYPGEALRLRSSGDPLVGGDRDGDLTLAHLPRRRQHDLRLSDRESASPRGEAPMMSLDANLSLEENLHNITRAMEGNVNVSLIGTSESVQPMRVNRQEGSSSCIAGIQRGFSPLHPARTNEPRIRLRTPFNRLLSMRTTVCPCLSPSTSESEEDEDDPPDFRPSWQNLSAVQRVFALRSSENRPVHKIDEYVYELVPELDKISAASFYWGRMDRFEAERLLENQPEGSFLLRDSAQPNFLFSVSFRRYQRTLHARIEHVDGRYGFDVLDDSVFSSPTILSLIENYSDPVRCLFYEPQLTTPLHRPFVFSLQHLARAAVAAHTTYEGVGELPLPTRLKAFVRAYRHSVLVRTTYQEPMQS